MKPKKCCKGMKSWGMANDLIVMRGEIGPNDNPEHSAIYEGWTISHCPWCGTKIEAAPRQVRLKPIVLEVHVTSMCGPYIKLPDGWGIDSIQLPKEWVEEV